MSKSAIYVVNTTPQTLSAGSIINLGNIVRRFGCNLDLLGNSIAIEGNGYYDVDCTVTITGTTTGTATISLLKDNVLVPGATASATTTAGSVTTVPILPLVREMGCCCSQSGLSLVLSGVDATISAVTVKVIKL